MISFKSAHYSRDIILFAVFCYVRHPVSYRDLEEIMAQRGVVVDHETLNRWVVKYAPLIAAATDFFWDALGSNGVPDRVVIGKRGANKAGLNTVNDFFTSLAIRCSLRSYGPSISATSSRGRTGGPENGRS